MDELGKIAHFPYLYNRLIHGDFGFFINYDSKLVMTFLVILLQIGAYLLQHSLASIQALCTLDALASVAPIAEIFDSFADLHSRVRVEKIFHTHSETVRQ